MAQLTYLFVLHIHLMHLIRFGQSIPKGSTLQHQIP
jgi:hypothetical protein